MLGIITYHPIRHVGGITAPVLMRGGLRDKLCSISSIRKAAAILGGWLGVVGGGAGAVAADLLGLLAGKCHCSWAPAPSEQRRPETGAC
jgi:hypothetical protein